MASISSVLQILVQAQTNDATSKLRQFDDKMAKTRAEASKKIEAQLGANFDKRAFAEYDAALRATQNKVKNRAAFKAALGADFDPRAFSAYQRSVAKAESDTRRMSSSVDTLAKRFSGSQNKLDGFNSSMKGVSNVVKLIKWPAMIAGAGTATQAIGALGSAAIGLTSALAPLSGALAGVAVGYTAIGQAAGVVKLAFSHVGTSLTAYSKAQSLVKLAQDNASAALQKYGKNSAQYKSAVTQQTAANLALQKSLTGLVPAQVSFVKQLQSSKKELDKLRQSAASGLFPGLTAALKNLQPLFKPIQSVVSQTAKALGGLAVEASKSFSKWGGDIRTIGGTNVTILRHLGGAAIALASAFKDLLVVAGPLATWMSTSIQSGAIWIAQQVAAGRASGRLAVFLAQTHAVMLQVWDIAKNLAVAFFDIGKAAAPLGRDLLNSIVLLTEKFRQWTASTTGKNDMRRYFDSMRAPIMAIGRLVGALGKAFLQLSGAPGLTHVVDKLTQFVPILQQLIASTTQGFSSTFIDALSNIAKLFAQLAGTSGPLTILVKAIGWLAGAFSSLLQSSPGVHSAVVDMVGLGAALKAISFIPRLPIIGSLIGLFTASGRAKSLASLLSFGKGGGLGGLMGKATTSVGTMTVGTLIAKTSIGGAGGVPAAGVTAAEGGAVATGLAASPLALAIGGGAVAAGAYSLYHNRKEFFGTDNSPGNNLKLGAGLNNSNFTTFLQGYVKSARIQVATQDLKQLEATLSKLEHHQAGVKQTAQALDELAQKAQKAGDVKWQLADTLGAELLRTHNLASHGVLDLIGQLNRLPPGARAAASATMMQMTQSLETQGQLPLGATARLVTEMLSHYQAGRDKTGVTFRGLMSDTTQTMTTLRQRISTSTGQQRQNAITEYNRLRTQTDTLFGQMLTSTTKHTGSMRDAVSTNTHQAFRIGSKNFQGLAANIAAYIGSGATATAKGLQNITDQINSALAGLGSKQKIAAVTVKASNPAELALLITGNESPGAFQSPHAVGGLIQVGRSGDRGRDTIPMNVGGTPIAVGSGEQVAVFNHHQQAVANAALAPIGGLSGLFSKVRTPHYMASGGIVGKGYAGGGMVGYGQLEGLWNQAGGPPNLAATMAAIAEAESGGNPNARNPSGASGLWQILGLPFAGNPFDAITNARMAVAKWRTQGLGAWVTYTSGAFKRFLNGAVPAMGGFGAPMLSVPKVIGGGPIGSGVQAGLRRVVQAANAKIQAMAPAMGMGTVGRGGGGFSPSQLTDFDGVMVAKWIARELGYARAHGWNGAVTSGYRGGFDPHTVNGFSQHSLDIYPGGAVDFGGMIDPAAAANRASFMRAVTGYGGPRLILPQGFRDDGHMSGTGHARGGIVYGGAFKNGGIVPGPAGQPTMIMAHGGEVVVPGFATGGIPSIARLTHMPAAHRLRGRVPTHISGAGKLQAHITGMRSQIDSLEHEYSVFDQFYNLNPGTLVDPNTGAVNQGAVAQRLHQLDTLISIRSHIFNLWQQVVAHTRRLVMANKAIIGRLQKALGAIKTKGLKGNALSSAQTHQQNLRSTIAQYRGFVSSSMGDLTSGRNDRDSAWLALLQLRGERSGTAGTQPNLTSAPPPPVIPTTDTSALLQTLLTQTQQTLAVSQAQYSAIQSMPPFAGSFATGGIVPGPMGAPRTIIAHGGESVGPGQITVQVVVQDGAVDPNKIHAIATGAAVKVSRDTTRLPRRRLPGGS
jgi:hypothetical protein